MSKVVQMDPGAAYRAVAPEIDAAVHRVFQGGWFILGAEVAAFEQEFAAYLGIAQTVGVANGTDAVALALRAVGILPGDRVATVSHTAVATVSAIELVGAEPVLVDVDPVTLTLNPLELARTFATVPGIRAVIPVHLYGQPADLDAILEVTEPHRVPVVEDCAQCHGAAVEGRKLGTIGQIAAFSFYPTKNLGAFGDGGAVATNDPALADKLRHLREYGWKHRYVSEVPGCNSRLDEIQAACLRVRLPHLDADNARRAAIAAAYTAGLEGLGLQLPPARAHGVTAWHQFVIRTPHRDALRARLTEAGIGTNIHYPVPVHLQPAYAGRVKIGPSGLGVSEAAARSVLSLPLYPQLTDEAVAQVIEAVRAAIVGLGG